MVRHGGGLVGDERGVPTSLDRVAARTREEGPCGGVKVRCKDGNVGHDSEVGSRRGRSCLEREQGKEEIGSKPGTMVAPTS